MKILPTFNEKKKKQKQCHQLKFVVRWICRTINKRGCFAHESNKFALQLKIVFCSTFSHMYQRKCTWSSCSITLFTSRRNHFFNYPGLDFSTKCTSRQILFITYTVSTVFFHIISSHWPCYAMEKQHTSDSSQ